MLWPLHVQCLRKTFTVATLCSDQLLSSKRVARKLSDADAYVHYNLPSHLLIR